MKYILIGGSGFIGQHFTRVLGKDLLCNLDIDAGVNMSNFIQCDILNKNDLYNYFHSSRYKYALNSALVLRHAREAGRRPQAPRARSTQETDATYTIAPLVPASAPDHPTPRPWLRWR